jgi:uncharacterized protein YjbI with pentapeptide repeats
MPHFLLHPGRPGSIDYVKSCFRCQAALLRHRQESGFVFGGISVQMTKLTGREAKEIVRVARARGEKPDLRGKDISLTCLSDVDFKKVNLSEVNLEGAILWS